MGSSLSFLCEGTGLGSHTDLLRPCRGFDDQLWAVSVKTSLASSNHVGPWAFHFPSPWQAREENVLFILFSAAFIPGAFPRGLPCDHHAGTHKAVILRGALEGGEPWSVGSIPVASNSTPGRHRFLRKDLEGLGHSQKWAVFSNIPWGGAHFKKFMSD